MNGTAQETLPIVEHSGRKTFAMLGAALLIGGALYSSQFSLPSVPVAAETDDQKDAKPAASTPHAVEAANAFLSALDDKQREKAVYDFDSKKKSNWSNLPVAMVPRNGIRMGDLTKDQRARAMDVVAAVLSKDGYQKVIDIVDGDQKLADGQGRGGGGGGGGRPRVAFGADEYYLAVFGQPSETKPWMVQFGGHHLGVNVTVIGKHFVLTPTHTGSQPAVYKRGDKEVRPLGHEIDAGFKLVSSLDEKQRAQAIIGTRPQGELLLGPGRDGKKIEPKGIKGSALTADQQSQLLDVIGAWVNIVDSDEASARMTAIKESIGETYFAWSGPTEKGKAAYFRVQGPSIVIEYAPQGGTDHIHTIVRDPNDDYGVGTAGMVK